MSQTLTQIAETLRNTDKKVQLIYGFNGTGKTRLSRELKELIAPKTNEDEDPEDNPLKVLYYNAFTEDLFYWDNDLEGDSERKLKIQPNNYTQWVLQEQGQDQNAITHFQHYVDDSLTPRFNEDFTEVRFSIERGTDEQIDNLKISKGEESNFIWSIFYSILEQVIDVLSETEPNDRETNQFDQLEYVFIDDPVSSLDENHLIELAVNLAGLIKSSPPELKFIVTTHNPLFYNVLHNELNSKDSDSGYRPKHSKKYRLEKTEDGLFQLKEQSNDSPFSYHLYLLSELKEAVESGQLKKYHFNFLRNILEKTSTFLGYKNWGDLLPKTDDGSPNPYEARIINISSHSKHSGEEIADLTDDDKRVLGYLVRHLIENYSYWQQEEQHA